MDRFEIATGKKTPTYKRKKRHTIIWAEGGPKNLPKTFLRRNMTDWSEDGWAVSVDTVESLLEELERQMTGLKDRHDRVMDSYMVAYESLKPVEQK